MLIKPIEEVHMEKKKNDEIRSAVRENYGKVAYQGGQVGLLFLIVLRDAK
jgi:hypothetical protein